MEAEAKYIILRPRRRAWGYKQPATALQVHRGVRNSFAPARPGGGCTLVAKGFPCPTANSKREICGFVRCCLTIKHPILRAAQERQQQSLTADMLMMRVLSGEARSCVADCTAVGASPPGCTGGFPRAEAHGVDTNIMIMTKMRAEAAAAVAARRSGEWT